MVRKTAEIIARISLVPWALLLLTACSTTTTVGVGRAAHTAEPQAAATLAESAPAAKPPQILPLAAPAGEKVPSRVPMESDEPGRKTSTAGVEHQRSPVPATDSKTADPVKSPPATSSSGPDQDPAPTEQTADGLVCVPSDTLAPQPATPSPSQPSTKKTAVRSENPTRRMAEQKELILPKRMPVIKAPEKFNHPLKASAQLVFMLGQDDFGNYLYGEGAIDEGAFEKFKRYVDFYAQKGIKLNRLMMHSPGGLVREGLKIGQYVRDNGWATDSDKHMMCYSACGLIYASGVKKRMQSGAQVGFHRPYNPNKEDTQAHIDQVYKEYQSYWSYIGGDSQLYDAFMLKYGREDMLILMAETAGQYMNIEVY